MKNKSTELAQNPPFCKTDVSGSSSRQPLCKGDGIDHCGYYTTIDCDECKYGGGRKNPEAKCNQNYR